MPYSDGAVSPIRSGPKVPKRKKKKKKNHISHEWPKQVKTRPKVTAKNCGQNYYSSFTQYLIELAFNDSYLFAMMHLIPADYTETLDCLSRSIAKHDVILPLAALFLLIKPQ